MRTIIFGAGGIGSVIGGCLVRSGQSAILVGRPGHVNTINNTGLVLNTPKGQLIIHLPAVTALDQISFQADDVVFLCMKSQDTEKALVTLRSVNPDVPLFCFQNGVRSEEIAAQYFTRVYGTMVRMGALYLRDGQVNTRLEPPGHLIMGVYPQGTDRLVNEVATNLRHAGFDVTVTAEVMPYKWGKLMHNLANAIGAITDARGAAVAEIAEAARNELSRLLDKAGIRWMDDSQTATPLATPPGASGPSQATSERGAQSSTWQSLTRQQGTVETDYLNGEVVRLAQRLGQRAPVNEALDRICQEMAARRETPGKYTPAELAKMVGIK